MARQLRGHGLEAVALLGGLDAWRASYAVEPIEERDAPQPIEFVR